MGEEWRTIREFPNYEVSNLGRVFNIRHNHLMSTSITLQGHAKITLASEWDGTRYTRSVARLVAEAFLDPPNLLCDEVILLDGDLTNLNVENLAWRPARFAWYYTRQLKTPQPRHYQNLAVINAMTEDEYESIVEAGMREGLLFNDIWHSTYTGQSVFPSGAVFEIIERV
jgi:hypothetical protein